MDFTTAEEKFYALMGRLAAGVITQEEFRARLEELIVQDDQGRTWMMGAQSGKWYRYDGKRWVQDTPKTEPQAKPSTPTDVTAPSAPPSPISEADIHPPSEERCPRCDHALIAGATFCDRCGLRLPGDTVVYSTTELAQIETEPCPKCDRPLPLNAPFCAGCGYRRSQKTSAPPPPPSIREPFAVPPPPPPPPTIAGEPADRSQWLNTAVIVLIGLLILCCLATIGLALFWPDSPVSLMNLLGGGPAGPTATTEPTQTPTYVTPTFTTGPSPTATPSPEPGGATVTATQPPPTRVRTPTATTAPTPPPLPTVTRAPTRPPASPTAEGLRFRLKEKKLVEEKLGFAILEVVVLDKNGQGIPGINVRIDGGDPATWAESLTTDKDGRCGHYALSRNIYNVTLVDYGVAESGIDCRDKHWEIVFEAY